jgi:hypothetical protein
MVQTEYFIAGGNPDGKEKNYTACPFPLFSLGKKKKKKKKKIVLHKDAGIGVFVKSLYIFRHRS